MVTKFTVSLMAIVGFIFAWLDVLCVCLCSFDYGDIAKMFSPRHYRCAI
jgi:hypothetical protein